MTTKYGVFSEFAASSTHPHNPAVKERNARPSNIKTPTCKQGKGNDATFDKFRALYEGEKYLDPLRAKLAAANVGRKGIVTDKPFKPASPVLRTFGGIVPHEAETTESHRLKGEVPAQPRGMLGGCTKKGGFGFNKTTISERQGYRGVAGEYEYIADPIHMASRQPAAATVHAPFRPSNPPARGGPGTVTRHLLARVKGAVGEFEWQPRPEPPGRAPRGGAGSGQQCDASPAAASAPFRPAAWPKAGPMATLAPYPEFIHDPDTLKARATLAARKVACDQRPGVAWRPNPGPRSDATRSIVRLNLK